MRRVTAVTLSFWLAAGVAADKPRLAYRSHPIEGIVADAQTKKPIADAVINAAWVLQPVNQEKMINGHRFYLEQVKTDPKGRFLISGWPGIKKAPQGWQLEPGSDPVLTIFHARYRHRVLSNTRPTVASADVPSQNRDIPIGVTSVWDKKTIILEPIGQAVVEPARPDTEYPVDLLELQILRDVIDREIAAYRWTGNAAQARRSQLLLAELLQQLCANLPEDLPEKSRCLAPESELGKLLTQYQHTQQMMAAKPSKPASSNTTSHHDKVIQGGIASHSPPVQDTNSQDRRAD